MPPATGFHRARTCVLLRRGATAQIFSAAKDTKMLGGWGQVQFLPYLPLHCLVLRLVSVGSKAVSLSLGPWPREKDSKSSAIWRFPDVGVAPDHHDHLFYEGFSLIKPTSYGGTTILRHPHSSKFSSVFQDSARALPSSRVSFHHDA